MSPPPSDARGGPAAILVSWLVGSTAAAARVGVDSARTTWAAMALAAAGLCTVWLLRAISDRARGWRLALPLVLLAGAGVAAALLGYVYPLGVVVVGCVLAHGALVEWRPTPGWPQRSSRRANLALAPLLISMVAWYRSGSVPAVVAGAIVAMAVLELYARVPGLTGRIDRAVALLAKGAGQLVSWTVAGVVMLLGVLPVHALSRLVGYSPLDSGWHTPSTAWVAVDPRRLRDPSGAPARPASMATLELPAAPKVRRRARLRWVLPGVVAAGLAVWWLPGAMDLDLPFQGTEDMASASVDEGTDTFTRAFEADPAFEDAPWARNLRLDLLEAWNNLEFNAASGGWTIRDISSQYINITDGERRTIPPDPSLGEPVTVWFFGGSAAFGAGQRDEHTIPSELVRRAGAEGIPLEVHNLAVPATVNWQSAMLLLAKLEWSDPPDLIVFYDGANDMALQDVLASRGRASYEGPASLVDGQLDQVLRERAEQRGASQEVLPPPEEDASADEQLGPVEKGRIVLARYLKGVEQARRASDAASVPTAFFWQPELRAKQPLTDADRETLDAVRVDLEGLGEWMRYSETVRAGLPAAGVTDLSSVFDGETTALYWDTVHTNEEGAALVADALFEHLLPTLRTLR